MQHGGLKECGSAGSVQRRKRKSDDEAEVLERWCEERWSPGGRRMRSRRPVGFAWRGHEDKRRREADGAEVWKMRGVVG